MSPRPRKVSDAQVFAAAYRAMGRLGPAELTLAEIAREAGVTAGALVQRFGSKRALLLALFEEAAADWGQLFEGLRKGRRSPLAILRSYADCMAAMGETPVGLAHHLAWLQLDLTDPEFGRHARTMAKAAQAEIRRLLEEAKEAGELRTGTDTAALARIVDTAIGGSLLSWGFHQEGSAKSWVRKDLALALRPYRRTSA